MTSANDKFDIAVLEVTDPLPDDIKPLPTSSNPIQRQMSVRAIGHPVRGIPWSEVRISGKSKLIQIGLDREFPVSRIQASLLDGVLPRDAIIALSSFCAASFTYLLSFIINDISKSISRNP
jgi:hypothetical protein